MTSRNEAAERLREKETGHDSAEELLRQFIWETEEGASNAIADLDEVIAQVRAAERRATVERLIDIHDCRDEDTGMPCAFHAQERRIYFAILDEEAR